MPWQDSNLRPAFVLHAIRSCQLSYTTIHIYLSEAKAHAGAQPCLRYLVIRSWTYSEPSLHLFVLFNIRIPAAHSAFILSHYPLGLTLLPICPSMTYHVGLADSELTAHACFLFCGRTPQPSFMLSFFSPPAIGLFRCRFDFCNVQACALAAYSPQ